jgi:hypothetical protein
MEQLNGLLEAIGPKLGPYLPGVLGALAIVVGAWLVARLVRTVVLRVAAARQLDERTQTPNLGATLAQVATGVVWLMALPALLGALELQGLLVPVNAMMSKMLGVVPGVLGAAVIFGIGFFVARVVRQIVTGLLTAAGSERLAAKMGVASVLSPSALAGMVGSVVFALVLLPTLAAALQTLGIEAIAKPVGQLLESVIALIPKLISAAVIVAIGGLLGRMLATLVSSLLAGLGLDGLPAKLGMGSASQVAGRKLSELAGSVVLVGALFLSITQALELIGFAVLTEAVAQLGGVFARLVVAVLILGAGLWLATVAARAVRASKVANADIVGQAARIAILFFTLALALRQTGLPADIITITYASVVGAVAAAFAIAFGLGGRSNAERLWDAAVASLRGRKPAALEEPKSG